MTPEGPYKSPYTSLPHYLIQIEAGKYAIVPDGTQPADAMLNFENKREARSWLKENGFVKTDTA